MNAPPVRRLRFNAAVDLLNVHTQAPERYPFLLQSAAPHPRSGRWDILLADPGAALIADARGVIGPDRQPTNLGFFEAFERWISATTSSPRCDELPFVGGWFFLLGYEAARWVEPQLLLPPSPHPLPDALAVRCHSAILFDRSHGDVHLVTEGGARELAQLQADVDAAMTAPPLQSQRLDVRIDEQDPQRYIDGAQQVLAWLRAGDTYQINLSRAWDARLDPQVDPATLYRRLRHSNPAPFAGLARWGDAAVISSSPERLLQLNAGVAQTRPIAGTRKRGGSAAEDAALREILLANRKERAEHVMLIDLGRNDLGRICRPGSVTVDELMVLESYAHVHHIVSNVRGQLRDEIGPAAALRALFPGGTITGCPKVRAMHIIAALEGEGRGPYTGSMGYLSRDGQLDSNILIRSLVWTPGQLRLRAGAGIVADSDPYAELEETRAKARGLLLSLTTP